MFGRDSKKKTSAQTSNQVVDFDPVVASNVHVMPQRFYHAPKRKKFGMVFLSIGGVVFVLAVSTGIYFFFLQSPATNNTIDNQNIPTRNTPATITNANETVVPLDVPNTLVNQPTTTAPIISNTNQPISNTNTAPAAAPQSGPDEDNDRLTTLEETVYGTDSDVSDTDGDGYTDGNEVLSFYDPTTPRITLENSNVVRRYSAEYYELLYPTVWQVRANEAGVSFQSSVGEVIQVVRIENPQRLSVQNWYAQQFPENGSAVTAVQINTLFGVRSFDQLTYYLADVQNPDVVYVISYQLAGENQINFYTTFVMMLNSFKLKEI